MASFSSLAAAVDEGQQGYLQSIGGWIIFFVFIHGLATYASKYNKLLASRPTVVAGTFHGVVTSWLASFIYLGLVDIKWWGKLGLPVSLAYLATDIVFYCMPKADILITAHHIVMMLCHFTSGTVSGAALAGAGDANWAQFLSVTGYLSELPNPFLNTRWFMSKTLKQHSFIYSLNNVILLVSWVGARLVLLPSNIVLKILPRYNEFVAADALDCFAIVFMGHVIITLMSIDWLKKLLRGGLHAYFVFDPKGEAFNPNVKKAN